MHLDDDDLKITLQKISNALRSDGILYCCFKYGDTERIVEGRYFNDMTKEKFLKLITEANIKLILLKDWITDKYNSTEKFINFILINKK